MTKEDKMNKTQARETALKLLYEQEFNKNKILSKTEDLQPHKYVQQILEGVKKNQKAIDLLIQQTSQSWKMDRMSLIDLNIMRIALYEMLYSSQQVPFKVCIDEAVEIAKSYGIKDSPKFINGILDTISKRMKLDT